MLERAAAMGFTRQEAQPVLDLLESVARLDDFDTTMDLARYCRIPLGEAARAIVLGDRSLRRLGLPTDTLRADVAGMAAAHATTFWGQMDVREAQGHTFSKMFTDTLERWFGPR